MLLIYKNLIVLSKHTCSRPFYSCNLLHVAHKSLVEYINQMLDYNI